MMKTQNGKWTKVSVVLEVEINDRDKVVGARSPTLETIQGALDQQKHKGYTPLDLTKYLTDEAGFRADAIRACGLEGHPKAQQAFNKAWEAKHADGMNEVIMELEELSELLCY